MQKLRFAKLDPLAVTPKQSHPGDAGYDLTAISYKYVANADVPFYNYEFGLAVEIPEGHVGLLFPRSSISNKDMMLTNCVGVIDSSFRGSLSARFKTTHFKSELPQIYKAGERVAQLVVIPYFVGEIEEVTFDELTKTVRGAGGYGSTNK